MRAQKIKQMEIELDGIELQRGRLLSTIPNIPHESVPEGTSAADNVVVRTWGEKPALDFAVKDHVDVAQGLGILDMERAGKITGARFAVLKGAGSQLERALTELAASQKMGRFAGWWYTAELDPVYSRLRRDPRFQRLAAQAREHSQQQRALLDEMRRNGEVPRREDGVAPGGHRRVVHGRLARQRQPEFLGVAHAVGKRGGLEQGLGRDAAAMEAGAADLVLVDESDLQTELRGPESGRVAAGSGAEDDEIEVVRRADGHRRGWYARGRMYARRQPV